MGMPYRIRVRATRALHLALIVGLGAGALSMHPTHRTQAAGGVNAGNLGAISPSGTVAPGTIPMQRRANVPPRDVHADARAADRAGAWTARRAATN